jgi:hypothetical protein
MPHSQSRALATATTIAPFSVRRAEQFIAENPEQAIGLEIWLASQASA